MDTAHIPEWIATIRKPDGSLLAFHEFYLDWNPQSDVVQIDGYLTVRDLRELADYIDRELSGRASD
jgi:hypothetical protein